MYIVNGEELDTTLTVETDKVTGNWLIKQGIPVLSKKGNIMLFSKTDKLNDLLVQYQTIKKERS